MLTNRTTKIKVIENGSTVKTVSNATINFGLDHTTFKKMISLAIRLSPQDPLYDVNEITLHAKSEDKDLIIADAQSDEEEVDIKTKIKKILSTLSPFEPLSISVTVTRPLVETTDNQRPRSIQRPSRPSRPSFGQENSNPADRQSPARKYAMSPAKTRTSTTGTSVGRNLRGMPSPCRNKTPKRINLPVVAPSQAEEEAKKMNRLSRGPTLKKNHIFNAVEKPTTKTVEDVEIPSADVIEQVSKEDDILTSMEDIYDNTDAIENAIESVMVENPLKEVVKPTGVEEEDDVRDHGSWKYIQEDGPVPDSPDVIQSFRPFQAPQPLTSCLKVKPARLSTVNASVFDNMDDDTQFTHNHGRQSIINEDDFHTPDGSPTSMGGEAAMNTIINAASDINQTNLEGEYVHDELDDVDEVAVTVESHDDDSIDADRKSIDPLPIKTPERKRTPMRRATSTSKPKHSMSMLPPPPPSGPVYSNLYSGMTAGEAARAFDNNLRNYDPKGPNPRKVISPHRRRKSGTASSSLSSSQPTGGKKREGNDLSPLFARSAKLGPDGRPSTGTMEKQWEFMRAHFVNNADDELEWLMVSKHKGAYKYAKRKHDEAEDKYFRALFECDVHEKLQKRVTKSPDGLGFILPKIISQFGELHKTFTSNPNDEASIALFVPLQSQLKAIVDSIEAEKESYLHTIFTTKTLYHLKAISTEASDKAAKAVRKARELSASIPAELASLSMNINASRKVCDDALEEMEKWMKRTKECDEYNSVMRQEEDEWLAKELVENTEALCAMRSYIPVNIKDISVNELIEEAKKQGGLLSLDLANEIKNNRLLHWLVTHKDDIAMENFLAGEKKAYFENIETLDIIELRALVLCLPEKFELDGDGKKNEWRSRVMARAKQMVSQQKGDSVKGGWDGVKNKRSVVTLPPLKSDLSRRPVYFYRSKEQCLQRLKQYDDKEAMLTKKTVWLTAAKKQADETKKEYDTILNEMRDPDLKAQYGADQFAMAKDQAKQEWTDAESKRKNLEREVKQLEKTIASAPISRDSFITSMTDIESCLREKGFAWESADQPPIQIEGVFDPVPELNRMERQATKFVSAEEEAEQRKREINDLMSKKDVMIQAAMNLPEEVVNLEDLLQAAEGTSLPESSTLSSEEGESVIGDVPPVISRSSVAEFRSAIMNPVQPISTPTSVRKRGSILETANPALINCLNNMFSPDPNRQSIATLTSIKSPSGKSMPIRRGTMFSPASAKMVEAGMTDDKKEIKTTQSKLLQRLLGAPGSSTEEHPIQSKPQMPSFLDQLKARGKSAFVGISDDGDDAKPKSFLDELKSKCNRGNPAKCMIAEEDGSEELDSQPPSAVKQEVRAPMLMKPAAAPSFLDSIKSRRVE